MDEQNRQAATGRLVDGDIAVGGIDDSAADRHGQTSRPKLKTDSNTERLVQETFSTFKKTR
jgi:hypothetical protein